MAGAGAADEHLDFLRNLTLCHQEGGYFFVHAGVRPGVALDKQTREDMLRIRQPFLYTERDLGAVVVHGHTPVKAPVVQPQPHRHRYRRGVRRQDDLRGAGRRRRSGS